MPLEKEWYNYNDSYQLTDLRDATGEELLMDNYHRGLRVWNFLCHVERDQYQQQKLMAAAAFFGYWHGWAFHHTIYQWVPSMLSGIRTNIVAIPTALVWVGITHWMCNNWIPRHHHRHMFDLKLRSAANSARYDAWKQQSDGLLGMR